MRARAERVRAWRWWPLAGYMWLCLALAGTLARVQAFEADRRRDRYQVCLRGAAERQAIYDLLTIRPPRPGTEPDVLAALERARRVFGTPTRCEELL